jgi:antitoxin (DNA-binding transcriptional repressor) of toxin-antitoxin stability system
MGNADQSRRPGQIRQTSRAGPSTAAKFPSSRRSPESPLACGPLAIDSSNSTCRDHDKPQAQLSGIRIDSRTLSRIRAGAGQPIPASTDVRRIQLERDLRAKATDHAARRLSTSSYLAEHGRITAEIDALQEQPGPPLGDVDEVVTALTALRDAWRDSDLAERAELVGRVYQRITVADGAIVKVELTDTAKRHGFLEALPENVVMARPAGLEPTTFRSAT